MKYKNTTRLYENLIKRLYLLPKVKFNGKYYDIGEDIIERLEGDGYIDSTTVPLTTVTRLNNESDVQRLKMSIECVFKVYPKDQRLDDGFEEIAVFCWDDKQEDIEDIERDIKNRRRTPIYVAYDLGVVEDYIGDIDNDLHI